MKTILLDVDGVLADCATPVYNVARRVIGERVPQPKYWHDFEFDVSMGLSAYERDRLYGTIHNEDALGWHVQPYPGAQDFVEELLGLEYDVVAVTAHWTLGGVLPCWVPARCELITECFFDIPVVFTHHKGRVQGDFLVDDGPHNLGKTPSRGILFDQPWNRKTDFWRRARTYQQVLEMVK
jgi:5'(3')-deoxyribonucleotidase